MKKKGGIKLKDEREVKTLNAFMCCLRSLESDLRNTKKKIIVESEMMTKGDFDMFHFVFVVSWLVFLFIHCVAELARVKTFFFRLSCLESMNNENCAIISSIFWVNKS